MNREFIRSRYHLADQMITAFSLLRDRCHRYALTLDLSILVLSLWATMSSVVWHGYTVRLVPPLGDVGVWQTGMAFGVVLLSIVQLRVDWKGAEARYERSAALYWEAKKIGREILSLDDDLSDQLQSDFSNAMEAAAAGGDPIPERMFIRLKRKHKNKLEISRIVDNYPAVPVPFIRVYLLGRDCGRFLRRG